jgi:transposase
MMESIPNPSWQVSAEDPMALTCVLDLPNLIVTGLEYDGPQERLYVFCEHTTRHAECPTCQSSSALLHDYTKRVVRDLPWAGKPVLLEFSARRFYCRRCRCPFGEQLPWLPRCSRLSGRYRQHLFEACRSTSLLAVSRREGVEYKTIERLYYALADTQAAWLPPEGVRKLGIDEFAIHKGHSSFALALYDLESGSIFALLPDRKKETLSEYFVSWTPQQRAAVEEVAMDLWEGYASAVADCMPHARIVADRFHVMKILNEQVSAARREIQATAPKESKETLKGCRWLLVRNEADLNEEDKSKLAGMFAVSPELERLHQLKEQFREILETHIDIDTAGERLREWIDTVQASGLKKLDKFLKTLSRRWEHILNYFYNRLTSGKVEGLNNKVKVIKRDAYGFRNFTHLQRRVQIGCDGIT